MLQILKTKRKEIAMKKRKSYAKLEPVKKKLCLERFCHYYNNVKNKKKRLQRLVFLYHMFSKKSKGRSRSHMFRLVFGQLPHLSGKIFLPLRFTEQALLVTPRANMNESSS